MIMMMVACAFFFFSSRRRHTRWPRDWSSDVCSSDLAKSRPDLMKQVALDKSYVLDLPTLPAKAADLIAQFKADKITTIVFLGDPIMPIYLTKAAEQQNYHPEWIFTGTALTDTNVLARQYDQDQMAHA